MKALHISELVPVVHLPDKPELWVLFPAGEHDVQVDRVYDLLHQHLEAQLKDPLLRE